VARSVRIDLPAHGWKPRPRQMRAWAALQAGCKRMVLVWHRRYGKDEIALHKTAISMVQRSATYWHMLPLKDQARTAIWEATNPHTGRRRIDEAFPDALFDKRETDMMIHCKINDSTWQIKGSDNYGAGIGSPPAGIVFSEYSRSNPDAWAYLRPILRENGGWAMFISTPYGHNHFENLYRYAISAEGIADGWFGELLTVEDTGSMTPEEIQRELRELAAERGSIEEANAIVNQEYFCSFDSAIPGAIYGPTIVGMEKCEPPRITTVPFNPAFAVEASTDLGASEGNDMAIWWHQRIGRETHVIDCDSAVGVGIDWVAQKLNERARDRGFVYAPVAVNLPHDAGHPQPSNEGAASFAQKLSKNYQYRNRVNPVTRSLAWSITRVKQFLPTCVFDATHCAPGLNALRSYHRKWDSNKRCYSENPVHDWASNYADAFRTMVEARETDGGALIVPSENPGVLLPTVASAHRRFAVGAEDDPIWR
jgi:phage terminase large subunit